MSKKPKNYIDPWVASEILRLARMVANPHKVPITVVGSPIYRR